MDNKLRDIEERIDSCSNLPVLEQIAILEPLFNEVYDEIKKTGAEIPIMLRLSQLENKLNVRMIEVIPKVEPSLERDKKEHLLKQIVYYARKKAQDNDNCNISQDSLRTRSLEFSNLLSEIAKGLQVPTTILDIGEHFHFPYHHYIVIAYVENDFYLLDCTYQQFFMLGYNFQNRYYEHPSYTRTCEIGGRMVGNRKESAEKMIKEGYLLVNSSDFKNYCDACAEFGNCEKRGDGISYLKDLLKVIERSSDKNDRILVSKMQYL